MFSAQAYSGHWATNGLKGRRYVTVAHHGMVKTPSSSTATWHYTPKHGSWLDMTESELGVLASQCLDRRNRRCYRDCARAPRHPRSIKMVTGPKEQPPCRLLPRERVRSLLGNEVLFDCDLADQRAPIGAAKMSR
jgi:hypothetical protein